MIKLLKEYKFVVLALCIGLIGLGTWIYEANQGDSFDLGKEGEEMQTLCVSDDEAFNNDELASTSKEEIHQEDLKEVIPTTVPVYICGEVQVPGVYYVLKGTLVDEVVKLSGGFTDKANKEYLNLASSLQGNEKIVVPKEGEEIDKTLISYDNREDALVQEKSDEEIACININTASVDELMNLPGIGAVKAKAILAYREEIGNFKSVEELSEVNGIGDKTLEKIKQLITIN